MAGLFIRKKVKYLFSQSRNGLNYWPVHSIFALMTQRANKGEPWAGNGPRRKMAAVHGVNVATIIGKVAMGLWHAGRKGTGKNVENVTHAHIPQLWQ